MKLYAIFKNNKQIGFPFNSFNSALLMLNSINDKISEQYNTELIDNRLYIRDLKQTYIIQQINIK